MKSVMQHNFGTIPDVKIQRSVFNRSSGLTTAFNVDDLIPVFMEEALPGDTFDLRTHVMGRLTTPIVPIMDNMFLEIFYFAVPNRILWENWERFMGAQDNPGDSTDYLVPVIDPPTTTGSWPQESIADYFGLPLDHSSLQVNALHFRAYNLIWNEWFRDQNLQESVHFEPSDGPDSGDDYGILKRNKKHDYFTSCLPWPQKGEAIELPLGTSAPVIRDGNKSITFHNGAQSISMAYDGTGLNAGIPVGQNVGGTLTSYPGTATNGAIGLSNDPLFSGMIADLSDATAATINAIRTAFQLQRMLERDARGGTRYVELIKSHFGVVSPDYRMQRPEFLGSSSQRINVIPVEQTGETGTTPQGNVSAFAYAQGSMSGFSKSFTEHCVILGIANIRSDIRYQQGLHRMWSRQIREDFYFPSLAHLGEQPVYGKEIFYDGTAYDEEVFGYIGRYDEYRYKNSIITGKMRTTATGTIGQYHLSEQFASGPVLGNTFITTNTPIDRVLAIETDDEPNFKCDFNFQLRCTRPMPTYSIPGLIDHF